MGPQSLISCGQQYVGQALCAASAIQLKAVAILPLTAIYPQRLFCRELFVIGRS